jgi:hypothetical protein
MAASTGSGITDTPTADSGKDTHDFHPAYRLPETSLDAEANGRETKFYQVLSGSLRRFAWQRLRVWSVRTSKYAALDPGGAGITAWW